MNLLHQDNNYKLNLIKYKNYQDYIRENQMDSFITDVIKNIPKEYIKEIKDINNKSFLAEIYKKEYYTPEIKYYKNYLYFSNCRIINKNLGKYLLNNIENTQMESLSSIFDNSFIYFMIIEDGKICIKYNLYIYIGYLNDKKIFQTEIIICCSNEHECKNIVDELKIFNLTNFLFLTKRLDENNPDIGKFNNTNNIVIILNEKYSLKEDKFL